jgi:hypothetical protein
MSRFLLGWSLISPACFSLILLPIVFWSGTYGYGFSSVVLQNSVIIYFLYWAILGCLQGGLLFWRFQRQKLAYRWGLVTGITGFSVMGMHDLVLLLLGVDLGGQGIVLLLASLPVLALAGGWILGLAQYFVLQEHLEAKPKQEDRRPLGWLGLSFVSWVIGFLGCWLSLSNPVWWYLIAPFPMALGTFLKGWFIQKYLAVPSQVH